MLKRKQGIPPESRLGLGFVVLDVERGKLMDWGRVLREALRAKRCKQQPACSAQSQIGRIQKARRFV